MHQLYFSHPMWSQLSRAPQELDQHSVDNWWCLPWIQLSVLRLEKCKDWEFWAVQVQRKTFFWGKYSFWSLSEYSWYTTWNTVDKSGETFLIIRRNTANKHAADTCWYSDIIQFCMAFTEICCPTVSTIYKYYFSDSALIIILTFFNTNKLFQIENNSVEL